MHPEEIKEFVSKQKLTVGFEKHDGTTPEIFKRFVIGYVIAVSEEYNTITQIPIYGLLYSELDDIDASVPKNHKIISVLSPIKLTFGVFGLIPDRKTSWDDYKSDGCYGINEEFLGFEIEGVEHPDWEDILKDKIISIWKYSLHSRST